ncbi:hypothetical protein G9A89_023965 [Geosiphon pyriformis]|nr:hypothetical protein G9A89_023965 [Geosiphon pyriformis]
MMRQPKQVVLSFKHQNQSHFSTLTLRPYSPSLKKTLYSHSHKRASFSSFIVTIESPKLFLLAPTIQGPLRKNTRLSRVKPTFSTNTANLRFSVKDASAPVPKLLEKKKNKTEKIVLSKSEAPPQNLNSNITKILEVLARKERDNVYKERVYFNAIRSISLYPQKLASGEEAKRIKGIGDSIAQTIDEILKTGTCKKLTEEIGPEDELQNLVTQVHGIGPVSAQRLIEKGCKSIDDVAKDPDLTSKQRIGIKYFNDLATEIPRQEMVALEGYIIGALQKLDEKYIATICGNFRLGFQMSRDIDLLVSHYDYISSLQPKPGELLQKIANNLEEKQFIKDHISIGPLKYMGICRLSNDTSYLHRRINMRLVPYDRYWLAVFTLTGDDEFIRYTRSRAIKNGLNMNEYILAPKDPATGELGEPLEIKNEEDIFKMIGMKYLPPEDRCWNPVKRELKKGQPLSVDWWRNLSSQTSDRSRWAEKTTDTSRQKQSFISRSLFGKELTSQTQTGTVVNNSNMILKEEIKQEIKQDVPKSRPLLFEVTKRIFKWPWPTEKRA